MIIKGLFISVFALLMMLVPTPLYAKGDTVRITIKGPGITLPIEITDPKIVADFRVWTGIGTSSNEY
jgi:hypothetical protein